MQGDGADIGLSIGLWDEELFDFPVSWREVLHPRRGGLPGPPVSLDGAQITAVSEWTEAAKGRIAGAIANPHGDHRLAEAARSHLAGVATPRGAATVANIVAWGIDRRDRTAFADAWISAYGLPFAAQMVAEMAELDMHRKRDPVRGGALGPGRLAFRPAGIYRPSQPAPGWRWEWQETAARLRRFLAVAADSDYQAAVAALADCRSTNSGRLVVSYLVPTETDWVDECRLLPWEGGHEQATARMFLLCSLGSAEQAATLVGGDAALGWGQWWSLDVLATLAEGIGSAIAPMLADAFDMGYAYADGRKLLLDVLGRIPTDEAFQMLLKRLGLRHVEAAVSEASERFPIRAMRLLAEAAAGSSDMIGVSAAHLLAGHMQAHPELTETILPDLPDETRAAVAEARRKASPVDDAPASVLPAVLADPPWTRETSAKPAGGRFPAKMPKIGDWANPGSLPRILLRGDGRALPLPATAHVITMLAVSKPDEMYPGLTTVREACDPVSLAEFGWALFKEWQRADMPAKDSWALTGLGWIGDDETVRRLVPFILAWPGDGGHQKAVAALDVLTTIGTEAALTHLKTISERSKFKALKARAEEKIEQLATDQIRGLEHGPLPGTDDPDR